jgi:hypothetical protein
VADERGCTLCWKRREKKGLGVPSYELKKPEKGRLNHALLKSSKGEIIRKYTSHCSKSIL